MEILGAVAACDQLLGTFISLSKKLERAYKVIKHAKEDVQDVMDGIETIEGLWDLFAKTMEEVKLVDGFREDLKHYRDLDMDIERQARAIISRIHSILDLLHPLYTKKTRVSGWSKLLARLRWFFSSQKRLQGLQMDLAVLGVRMRSFLALVQIRISVRQYRLSQSAATRAQLDDLQRELKDELRKISNLMKAQRGLLRHDHIIVYNKGNDNLLVEVQKIIRKEVRQIQRVTGDVPSNPGSSSAPSRLPAQAAMAPSSSRRRNRRTRTLRAPTTQPNHPPGPLPTPLSEHRRSRKDTSSNGHPRKRSSQAEPRQSITTTINIDAAASRAQPNGAQILRRSGNTRPKKPAEEDNGAQQPRNIKGSAEGTHAQDHPQPTQPTTSTGSVVSQQAPSEGSSDSLIAEAQPNRISSHPYQYNLHSNVSMASLAARRGRRYSHRHGDGTAASGVRSAEQHAAESRARDRALASIMRGGI